jgi:murein DD-endopeptidase MepM/ murein hydrolase activator NlpD
VLRKLGVAKAQFNRYAYDFSLVDADGKLNRTGGKTNEDWFGYGTTVVAPGDGVVRYAQNNAAEHHLPDDKWDEQGAVKDPRSIPGNHVVIDHGNGECSLLAHMKQGSVTVKVGDHVSRGQPIGQMGLSGDSDWLPHVHYQLMNNCDFMQAEGLPSYFSDFRRVAGDTALVRRGQIDTGDIVITKP